VQARPPYATIPEPPTYVDLDAARMTMGLCRDNGNPCAALHWAQVVLRYEPKDRAARECALQSRAALERQYVRWLGGWSAAPRAAIGRGKLRQLGLDPEQAAVLRHMDGRRTIEDLVDMSSMPALAVLKAIFGLVHAGAVVTG
jgi:hypothetical protein